jgi:CspA family cold shock protein
MALGTVTTFSPSRGSGWIRPDSGGNLVYVHKSGIANDNPGTAPKLEKGQRVEYQIGQRPKGAAAINVRPATETAAADAPAPEAAAESVETAAAE